MTLPWRCYTALRRIPVLGRLSTLAVEVEAALFARAEMKECGIWLPKDAVEATFGLLSYVCALFFAAEAD